MLEAPEGRRGGAAGGGIEAAIVSEPAWPSRSSAIAVSGDRGVGNDGGAAGGGRGRCRRPRTAKPANMMALSDTA